MMRPSHFVISNMKHLFLFALNFHHSVYLMVSDWFTDVDHVQDVVAMRCSLVLHLLTQFAAGMKRAKVDGLVTAAVTALVCAKTALISLDASFADVGTEWQTAWSHCLARAGAALQPDALRLEILEYKDRVVERSIADFSRNHPELVGGIVEQSDESQDKDHTVVGDTNCGAPEDNDDKDDSAIDNLTEFYAAEYGTPMKPSDVCDHDWEQQMLDVFGPDQFADHPDANNPHFIREFAVRATSAIQLLGLGPKEANPEYVNRDEDGNLVLVAGDTAPKKPSDLVLTFAGSMSTMPSDKCFPACRAFGRLFYIVCDHNNQLDNYPAWMVKTVDEAPTMLVRKDNLDVKMQTSKVVSRAGKSSKETIAVTVIVHQLVPRSPEDGESHPFVCTDEGKLGETTTLTRSVGAVELEVKSLLQKQKDALKSLKAKLGAEMTGTPHELKEWMKDWKHLLS